MSAACFMDQGNTSNPTLRKNRKRELTRLLLAELNIDLELDIAMSTWYMNIRESGGFRLTESGYKLLKASSIESYRFTPQTKRWLNKSLLLDLDRRVEWPYYIDRHGIEFFSSREAMMAGLYGDLERWLKSLG